MAEKARKCGRIGVKTDGQTVKVEDGEEESHGWRSFSEVSIFKYTNFFYQVAVAPFSSSRDKIINLPLPLGVSFITFTLIAYLVDVYKRHYPVEKNLTKLSAYVFFFPHLIAGPILRPHELLPQFEKLNDYRRTKFSLGFMLFAVGMAKKLLLADQIAASVETAYADSAGALNSLDYIIAFYGFSVQIYCDFSGYTDMAIGLALIIGIRLPNNFNKPYTSESVAEFWRRWHLTLSRWLQSYIYIPLGGNRQGMVKRVRNVFITMTIGGLWHGANWTFIAWGLLHSFAISGSHLSRRYDKVAWLMSKIPQKILIIATFHFVTFAWVFFRAPDFSSVARVLGKIFAMDFNGYLNVLAGKSFVITLIILFFIVHKFDTHSRVRLFVSRTSSPIVWSIIAGLFILSLTVSIGDTGKFIYFDF